MNPYDQLPYPHLSYAMVHPGHMAVVATLLGIDPPDVETARILEIGCASGGNLIPIAAQLPRARLVGIDLSERQVQAGQDAVAKIGLENLELRQMDIRRVTPGFGEFDYILAHGVYSWVPSDAQDALLRLCRENLAPDGIALVSYNTYPGWTFRGMVRDMVVYHARRFDAPARQVSQARRVMDLLAGSADRSAMGGALREAAEQRRKEDDAYIFHDDLETENEPLWFREFAERAHAQGLRHIGDVNPAAAIESGESPAVKQLLAEAGDDVVLREQYLDFFRNRAFRESLLVHAAAVATTHRMDPRRLETLWLGSDLRPVSDAPDLSTEAPEDFQRGRDGTLQTTRPLTKAVLCVLRECWPRTMPFAEMVDLAWDRTGLPGREPPVAERAALANDLFYAFAGRAIQVRGNSDEVADTVTERPRAFGPARLESERGAAAVPNVRHGRVHLDDFARRVLVRLDGKNDVAAIVEGLVDDIDTRGLELPGSSGGASAEDDLRGFLAAEVRGRLESMLQTALLVA